MYNGNGTHPRASVEEELFALLSRRTTLETGAAGLVQRGHIPLQGEEQTNGRR
jgi:hypothetical protein